MVYGFFGDGNVGDWRYVDLFGCESECSHEDDTKKHNDDNDSYFEHVFTSFRLGDHVVFSDWVEDVNDSAVGESFPGVGNVWRDDSDQPRREGVKFVFYFEFEGTFEDDGYLLVGVGMLGERGTFCNVPESEGHVLRMDESSPVAGDDFFFF